MVHYHQNKINLAFDAQYRIVTLNLITYFFSGIGLGFENHLLCLIALKNHWRLGLSLENAGLEPMSGNECAFSALCN